MRNVPIQFVAEDTVEHLTRLYDVRAQAAQVARPLALDTEVVAASWPEIEQHKWVLSEKLGRDVGPQVAALDYFENFGQAKARGRRSLFARIGRALLENLDADGPYSVVQFERVMRGTRTLAR